MGSNDRDSEGNEQPFHSVTLDSYYIGQYEVTQQQWMDVMGYNPSSFKDPQKPVENVTWYDCVYFCNELSCKMNLDECYELNGSEIRMYKDRNGFRLPTEAEWEFAARGGAMSQGYVYSGSNNINEVSWYSDNSNNKTHCVGQKKPNELGLYDMSGNVWEWCWDWYEKYSNNSRHNPSGARSGLYKIDRGGCYFNLKELCTSMFRYDIPPLNSNKGIGLRLVRSL